LGSKKGVLPPILIIGGACPGCHPESTPMDRIDKLRGWYPPPGYQWRTAGDAGSATAPGIQAGASNDGVF